MYALINVFIPGLGHAVSKRIGTGIFWFLFVGVAYIISVSSCLVNGFFIRGIASFLILGFGPITHFLCILGGFGKKVDHFCLGVWTAHISALLLLVYYFG